MTLAAVRPSRHTPAMEEDAAIELVRNIGEIIEQETGLRGDLNAKLAEAVVIGLRKRYPSERIYVPSANTIATAARHEAIRAEWRGNNNAALAERYRLSPRQISRIVAPDRVRQEALETRRVRERDQR